MIFALNSRGNDSVNLLIHIISTVSAGLATLAWMHHGKLFNDILEGAFILNLYVFAAATCHVKQNRERQDIMLLMSQLEWHFQSLFVFCFIMSIYPCEKLPCGRR